MLASNGLYSFRINKMYSAAFGNNFSKFLGKILGIVGDVKGIARKNKEI